MPALGPYLDGIEVQQRYRISVRTLRRWLKDEAMGFPKPFRINRRFYFKVADLDRWDADHGAIEQPTVDTARGLPIVSDVIRDYAGFVGAMAQRRKDLRMTCSEVDHTSGMQESYTNKLENWGKDWGRGLGPDLFPLWLGGLRMGIVLVDLPRRPYRRRQAA